MKIKKCRICNNEFVSIVSLGEMPIVNFYLSKEEVDKPEKLYPLVFCICENCGLAQIDEYILPEKLFSIYHYSSSASSPLRKHLEELADICGDRFKLDKKSNILDIGCNDGIFLGRLAEKGVRAIGVDPAKNMRAKAESEGAEIIDNFFNESLSKIIKKKYGHFDLILATNTLSQILDLHDFIRGVAGILKKDGVFVVEVGYLPKMVANNAFDSIYHEHLSFFSLDPLNKLFKMHALEIFDAEQIAMHGGSLRVFVKHKNANQEKTKRFKDLLRKESKLKLHTAEAYLDFIRFTSNFKNDFKSFLLDLKRQGKKIIGIGAPAKSVVLLNYCRINSSLIDYITDSTSYKQNRYVPGVHIPVFSEEKWEESSPPDYFILFAWTYKDELIKKIGKYKKKGSKIIIPFPKIEII